MFLTPEGDCGGLYIKSKRGDGFEVRELQGGTSNVAFFYRIVGRRRDIKRHKRFARIDITPPMQITKPRTAGRTAARAQALARKLRARDGEACRRAEGEVGAWPQGPLAQTKEGARVAAVTART